MPSIRDTIGSSGGDYECQSCRSFQADLEDWDVASERNDGGKDYQCPNCSSVEWVWKPGETVFHKA